MKLIPVGGKSYWSSEYNNLQGRGWQKEIPNCSRSDDAALDLALLRGIATGVECPKCDANLDLRKVGSDMTYRCDYCGATGIVELVKTQH